MIHVKECARAAMQVRAYACAYVRIKIQLPNSLVFEAHRSTKAATPSTTLRSVNLVKKLVRIEMAGRNEVEWENGICGCFNDCSLCKHRQILVHGVSQIRAQLLATYVALSGINTPANL